MDKMGILATFNQSEMEAIMTRVSATDFKNNIGAYSDAAMSEPVIITSHHRDRLVLLSADEYRRLTGTSEGITDDDKARITRGLERHRNTIMELAKR
ncbi:type II toxin-antitoxin system prevent-host-death family antitoxin [Paracoccus marcusii]|uniref:type II toxin-antitoxin system prevent-host-death family antitoxin n=1 Tax=Paracoccus marcusii TaxID=59779 RepID=UPI0035A679FF